MRNGNLICIISDHNMSYIHRELAMTSADEVDQALQQAARSSCLTVYNFRFTDIILVHYMCAAGRINVWY
jgi:hypothetical protein